MQWQDCTALPDCHDHLVETLGEPALISDRSTEVNKVTASEQLGAYELFNVTNEFGVRLGFHF